MITLRLERRKSAGTVEVDVEMLSKIMDLSPETASKQLYKLFRSIEQPTTHDKRWLELIVNWSPPDGLLMTIMVPWLVLAERVTKIDDTLEVDFELTSAQADLIYNRLIDGVFRTLGLNASFASFVLMFFDAIGKHPDSLTNDLMFEG